jgi:hypothetical protein
LSPSQSAVQRDAAVDRATLDASGDKDIVLLTCAESSRKRIETEAGQEPKLLVSEYSKGSNSRTREFPAQFQSNSLLTQKLTTNFHAVCIESREQEER